jgi:uncharacterized membrane protein
MIALGIVIGFILGAVALGWAGGIAGAFTGLIVMLAWRSRSQARERMGVAPVRALSRDAQVAQRLAAIEARLSALERAAHPGEPVAEPSPVVEPAPALAPEPPPTVAAPPVAPPATAPQRTEGYALWSWFTGGNALARIGVIALFFGVGFLLKYLAEVVTIPIEIKLAGVALVGAAIMLLGVRLARVRPGYGLSLEGAGAGMLYLTTFAALRPYEVLSPTVAFALLVVVAALTVWLAVRSDSQPLAGLAIAGGFLAPFLVATQPEQPALLFGYFLVLNAAILALAWVRAWHGLNVLGFVFTFALALFWGEQYYKPQHFATVEPFLVAFFVFYVAIAILYAKRGALVATAPVDAVLVFGVPLLGLALQASLVHDTRYGVAWSALAMAAVYASLSFALSRRSEPGFALLSRAFFVLAVVFATVAIPFAADPQWTSAWWALEAAAVYWIGCRQAQWMARGFALLLQIAAALAFAAGGYERGERLFLNAAFLGSILIALAALATAYVADRHRDALSVNERRLVPVFFVWGMAWWYGGGALEIVRALPATTEANAVLAYSVASVASALVSSRLLAWPRLAWFGAGLLAVMAAAAIVDWDRQRTTLIAYGWLVWPLAWLLHWCVLRAGGALRGATTTVDASLRFAHAASAIALVSWLAWEASEWIDHAFPVGTVWVACGAAWPAIAYLFATRRMRSTDRWPFADYRDAYVTSAATAIAALTAVWFLIVNVISPGSAAPLPYVPIANPLDATLVAALFALFLWARAPLRVEERTLYLWFGAALFLLVNAIVFRAVHQWLDVPWRLTALLASKPLQAALTLTWSATALPLMLVATRRAIRPLWMTGAAMLAVVVVKLFAIDLASLSGLPRVVAFLGVGALLLLIGYLAPLPPAMPRER